MSTNTIAVVGATGLIGRQVLANLWQHDVEPDDVRLLASEKSEGTEADYAEETLPVERPAADSYRGVKAAILAVPAEVAKVQALEAQKAGAWAVDLSGAFRLDMKVPLVAPGVNDGVLDRPFPGRVVSVASPAAQALTLALEPLRAAFGLAVVDATVLHGAAARGNAGTERLSLQTAALLNAKEPDVDVFPHRLAFNVIPGVGDFENGLSAAERHLLVEVARIWGGENPLSARGDAQGLPAVTSTALFVPTFHGATLIITAHLKTAVDVDTVRATLKASTELKVLDDPSTHIYPMPMLTTDDAAVHVGRLRAQGTRVQLVAAVDSAFRAAETAVDLALELADRA
ncbi:MAG: Asd/ArgC dimerization domain-containing protein [Myxococcota bacterium]|jgi:aspartate-semialdehyde dehydrogenase